MICIDARVVVTFAQSQEKERRRNGWILMPHRFPVAARLSGPRIFSCVAAKKNGFRNPHSLPITQRPCEKADGAGRKRRVHP